MSFYFKSTISVFILLLVGMCNINAQPEKFGDVSKEEFTQELSEEEAAFSAVKLFKYGNYEIQKEFKYKVVIHERIKILTDEGVNLSNFVIQHNKKRYDQELKKVEAFSFNLKENGKVDKTKLDDDNIFEEKGERDWIITKLAIPRVSKGTIIDIRYELELGSAGQLPNWYFNESIPVKWSELQFEIPLFHRFELVSNLIQELDINRVEDSFTSINYSYTPSTGSYATAQTRKVRLKSPSQKFTLVMKNTKPIKNLPYLSSINNYRSFIFFQFKGVEIPNYGIKEIYAKSWAQIINDLISDKNYGQEIGSEGWSKNVVESYSSDSDLEMERFYKTVDYLSSFSIMPNNEFYIREDLKSVNNEKKATTTEINLLMIKLLRSVGIKADPVLISTRNNGRIFRDFVLPDQFNKTISLIFIDEKSFLFDASSKTVSALLPLENLNGNGLRVSKNEGEWINLNNRNISRSDITLHTKVSVDGSIENRIEASFSGYDVYDAEDQFTLKNAESFLKDFTNGSEFENFKIVNTDTSEDLFFNPELDFELTFTSGESKSESANDSLQTIYLKVPNFRHLNLPALSTEKRDIPIEFPYKSIRSITHKIEFPEGYVLDTDSENLSLIIDGEPVNYTENYSDYENTVTVKKTLVQAKDKLSPRHFSKFKQIIDSINDEGDFIVLKKKE